MLRPSPFAEQPYLSQIPDFGRVIKTIKNMADENKSIQAITKQLKDNHIQKDKHHYIPILLKSFVFDRQFKKYVSEMTVYKILRNTTPYFIVYFDYAQTIVIKWLLTNPQNKQSLLLDLQTLIVAERQFQQAPTFEKALQFLNISIRLDFGYQQNFNDNIQIKKRWLQCKRKVNKQNIAFKILLKIQQKIVNFIKLSIVNLKINVKSLNNFRQMDYRLSLIVKDIELLMLAFDVTRRLGYSQRNTQIKQIFLRQLLYCSKLGILAMFYYIKELQLLKKSFVKTKTFDKKIAQKMQDLIQKDCTCFSKCFVIYEIFQMYFSSNQFFFNYGNQNQKKYLQFQLQTLQYINKADFQDRDYLRQLFFENKVSQDQSRNALLQKVIFKKSQAIAADFKALQRRYLTFIDKKTEQNMLLKQSLYKMMSKIRAKLDKNQLAQLKKMEFYQISVIQNQFTVPGFQQLAQIANGQGLAAELLERQMDYGEITERQYDKLIKVQTITYGKIETEQSWVVDFAEKKQFVPMLQKKNNEGPKKQSISLQERDRLINTFYDSQIMKIKQKLQNDNIDSTINYAASLRTIQNLKDNKSLYVSIEALPQILRKSLSHSNSLFFTVQDIMSGFRILTTNSTIDYYKAGYYLVCRIINRIGSKWEQFGSFTEQQFNKVKKKEKQANDQLMGQCISIFGCIQTRLYNSVNEFFYKLSQPELYFDIAFSSFLYQRNLKPPITGQQPVSVCLNQFDLNSHQKITEALKNSDYKFIESNINLLKRQQRKVILEQINQAKQIKAQSLLKELQVTREQMNAILRDSQKLVKNTIQAKQKAVIQKVEQEIVNKQTKILNNQNKKTQKPQNQQKYQTKKPQQKKQPSQEKTSQKISSKTWTQADQKELNDNYIELNRYHQFINQKRLQNELKVSMKMQKIQLSKNYRRQARAVTQKQLQIYENQWQKLNSQILKLVSLKNGVKPSKKSKETIDLYQSLINDFTESRTIVRDKINRLKKKIDLFENIQVNFREQKVSDNDQIQRYEKVIQKMEEFNDNLNNNPLIKKEYLEFKQRNKISNDDFIYLSLKIDKIYKQNLYALEKVERAMMAAFKSISNLFQDLMKRFVVLKDETAFTKIETQLVGVLKLIQQLEKKWIDSLEMPSIMKDSKKSSEPNVQSAYDQIDNMIKEYKQKGIDPPKTNQIYSLAKLFDFDT